MAKGTPTKTTNPIHFEDLEPKRFEDLVRELIYDFRDWQSIEATGQGGADDGFDIRAFERQGEIVLDDDGAETVHPMDGNCWMIQCKREKQIGPTKLENILEDVDSTNPPYGYILAAPVSFSKKSFDAFRDKLKSKGVMEFYLWGKPELEGQLHLPKNDRILFTFFGVSNVSRRRSRATEIRFGVTNKNKILRTFSDGLKRKPILVRDSKDAHYPLRNRYSDFNDRPRWKEYKTIASHPLGLIVKIEEFYAFHDSETMSYDFTKVASLIFREGDDNERNQSQREKLELVRDYWERFPKRNQAKYHLNGLIRYDAMLVIDEKGDNWNNFPHIYVDFIGSNGPFKGYAEHLSRGHDQMSLDGLTKVDKFPASCPGRKFGTIHDEEPLPISDRFAAQFVHYQGNFEAIYDCDGKFDNLKPLDVGLVRVEGKEDAYLQVTYRYETTVEELLKGNPGLGWQVEEQIGRKPGDNEKISVIEFRRTSEGDFSKG